MGEKILFIGGHGMMGRPVVRHLVKEGFTLRALARDVKKARGLLPEAVEVVQGDLKDVDSIQKAAENMDAVYLNIDTPNPKASFTQDVDGTKNVVQALKDQKDVLIIKLGAHGIKNTNGWWLHVDLMVEAENIIKKSGNPYLFFHPTWFMESLPVFAKDNDSATVFGKKWYPMHWIAGDDYAKMVGEALKKDIENKTYNVQGPEALDFDEAAKRFLKAGGNKDAPVYHIPIAVLYFVGFFSSVANELYYLFRNASMEEFNAVFEAQDTWDELYEPKMKIEDYYDYMKSCNDIPSK